MSDQTIRKTVFMKAAPETIWPFLVDKDKLGEWYHHAENDLVLGQDYSLIEDGVAVIWGTVLEMDAPRRLATTFNIAPFNGTETTLTWTLKSAAGGTQVTLTHDGIAQATGKAADEMLEFLAKGWELHLNALQTSTLG